MNLQKTENYVENLCGWLREEKGITRIDMMDLVSYIPEYDEWLEANEKAWTHTSIKCDLCGHKWEAAHHIESKKLECPNCGFYTIIVNKEE